LTAQVIPLTLDENPMKKLTLNDLSDLIVGSAILGSGGGGDPTLTYLMAKYEMEKRGFISLIGYNDLKPDGLIIPIGVMGAPIVLKEKIPNGHEFLKQFELIEKTFDTKITAVMPCEIGGISAFIPLIVAAQAGLPILDADTMGRSFPEAQMSSCNLQGASCSPGFISDGLGNITVIYAVNSHALERIGRHIIVAMGSIGFTSFFLLKGSEAERCTVSYSISKAIAIGKAHRIAKENGKDPVNSILSLCKGILIGSGKITDVDCVIDKGFNQGMVKIQNNHEDLELTFQNEYLLAKRNGEVVATTPDIIMLLEENTGTPITSEWLQYGLKVNLIALPAPSIWTTPKGLQLVGPRHFGFEVDYKPINTYEKIS
jgi:DUF917 family protein